MASFAFTDFGSSDIDGTTFTDTLTVGAGSADRTFFIPFAGRRSAATGVTSVTVDGEPAELVSDGTLTAVLLQAFTGDGSANIAAIAKIAAADLPDPTTADGDVVVEIIFNGTMLRAGWAIGDTPDAIEDLATQVARDGEDKSANTDATLDVSLNTPANGIVVGVVFAADTTAASASFTWTGATEPVGGDFRTGAESGRFGVASESNVAAATPRTVSVLAVHAGTQFSPLAIAVSMAPAAGDTTAPVLSNPTAAATGQTTASLGVDTDEGNGTLSWVVTTSSTSPSGAQVAAGQDHTGAAAADSGSQAVSGTGTQSISGGASGLTAGTTYWAHFVQDDAAANRSTVVTSSSFTTDSVPVPPPTPITAGTSLGGGGRRRRYPYPNVIDDGWDYDEPLAPPRSKAPEAEEPQEAPSEPAEAAPVAPRGKGLAVTEAAVRASGPVLQRPSSVQAVTDAKSDRVASLEAEVESLREKVERLEAARRDDEEEQRLLMMLLEDTED